MEEIIPFLFVAGIVLFVLFGPWILLWRSSLRRKREREEDQARWHDLTSRVYSLERTINAEAAPKPAASAPSQPAQAAPVEQPSAATRERAEVSAPAAPPLVAPVKPHVPTSVAPPSVPLAPLPVVPPTSPVTNPTHAGTPVAPPAPTRSEVPVHASVEPPIPPAPPPIAPPQFGSPAAKPSTAARLKSALDIEEALGTNWLNKVGVSLLVLGIAFFLAYEIKNLGPAGKVLVGFVVSTVMLAAGVWFERNNRYRILARAGVGGGWALLFFTTFAMYHVQAAQVLQSQALDLVLMLVVAAAMVWHTLRYRSQVVTGLAFLLAFLTVTISHSNVYSLSAGAVLALGLVVIVVRMQWFELEVFGILASYLNHYLWLRPIIEPMQGRRHPFPEFLASAGILIFYWLVFRISYVLRRPESQAKERISTAAALLNSSLLLVLLKYQSVHPEWALWALLALGAIEIGLGQLPITRRRRSAVIVLSTLGVVLLVAAFPFRYSGMRLSVLWMLEAEALLLVGVWTREIVFRRLGAIASLVMAGQMISVDAAQICGIRMDGADVRSKWPVAILFAVAAAVFYANSHWVFPRWKELFTTEFDRRVMHRLSYVAALMALIGAWIAFPESWTAVAWCTLGLALAMCARRFDLRELGYQGNVVAALGFVRVLAMNLTDPSTFHGLSVRAITVCLVGALLYAMSHWSWTGEDEEESTVEHGVISSARQIYTWAGSLMFTLLAWYELRPANVAVAWCVLGLLLALVGRRLKLRELGYQANALAGAAFVRVLAVNFDATARHYGVTERAISVSVVAVLLYVSSRWSWTSGGDSDFSKTWQEFLPRFVSGVYTCGGSLLLALLAWYELRPVGVAVAWAVGGLLLLEVGLERKSTALRLQSYAALLAAFVRLYFVNFNAAGLPGELSPRFYTVIPVMLAFFYAYERLRGAKDTLNEFEQNLRPADFCCWLGTISVASLMRFELPADWVAAAWAALAFGLIAIAWRSERRVFLQQAILIGFAVLFRTALHNFYERSYFPAPPLESRWVCVGATVALLFLCLPILFKLRRKDVQEPYAGKLKSLLRALARRPEQVFFFSAVILLTVLLALEMRHGMVTLSWGVEGFAIFLLALTMQERSFRLTGLALLLLCVGKILAVDVWRLQQADRYLTLIVLGGALVLVSFLYTRHREAIRQYL